MSYRGLINKTFDGVTFVSGVQLRDSKKVLFVNCTFKNIREDRALYILNSNDIVVSNCSFMRCSNTSIYAQGSTDVKVIGCSHLQTDYDVSLTPYGPAKINFCLFNNVRGSSSCVRGCKIVYQSAGIGIARVEDVINMYQSYGSGPDDPVIIDSNMITGGGKSTSGTGIIVDNGSGNIQISGNTLSYPGRVGVSAASGSYCSIIGNSITGGREIPGESSNGWGVYAYKTKDIDPTMTNLTISGNTITWYRRRDLLVSKAGIDQSTLVVENNVLN